MADVSAEGARVALMRRGEIWKVSLDPTQGHEQQGWRPVVVISPDAFNRVTGVPIVLPVTHGERFASAFGFAVPLGAAGTKTTGIIRCDQPQALDLKARKGRRLEMVPEAVLAEVLARVRAILA